MKKYLKTLLIFLALGMVIGAVRECLRNGTYVLFMDDVFMVPVAYTLDFSADYGYLKWYTKDSIISLGFFNEKNRKIDLINYMGKNVNQIPNCKGAMYRIVHDDSIDLFLADKQQYLMVIAVENWFFEYLKEKYCSEL